ncbi:MAG: intradiol ring-cleavage dioxygenase [Herpetosiphonaceae bacterium]|nr:intradiol ring-cleavage dioxygenase [Herpetosiphonaceae bacterium]
MDHDDRQIGRILSRRQLLKLLGAAGASLLVGCGPAISGSSPSTTAGGQASTSGTTSTPMLNAEAQTAVATASNPVIATATSADATTTAVANASALPACVVRPAVTEGPYYVDEELKRSDIRSDPGTGAVKDGVLLALTFNVSKVSGSGCVPYPGAIVDIWHCDASGVYSDVTDRSFNTKGQKFLRGLQVTDGKGLATFTTIYPGWYAGRAIHIHFKIRSQSSSNQSAVFTSQLFFDDAFSDQVLTLAPYASKGRRDTLNSNDGIYKEQLLLTPKKTNKGYAATFDIGIQTA